MLKSIIFLACSVCFLAPGLAVAANPLPCSEGQLANAVHPQGIRFGPAGDRASRWPKGSVLEMPFEPPILKYPHGSLDVYGFDLTFVVDAAGQVECATVKPAYRSTGAAVNSVRQAFLGEVASWRFKPFMTDSKPVRVVVNLGINEEELPQAHVNRPDGDPAQVTITQDNWPWMASYGAYHVELHGDGTAIYTARDPLDPLGPQTYHVDPKAVQGLVAEAEKADFWSLRDQYRSPNALENDGLALDRLNLTLGGKTKSLTDINGSQAGMPKALTRLQQQVMETAHITFWQTPDMATLDQLKINGFNFQSARGGSLLLRMMQNRSVKDATVLALMDLGAPFNAKDAYDNETLIEASLRNGRAGIAGRLIAGGALLTEGKPDQVKIDWAFYAALKACRTDVMELIEAQKPDLTYTDYDDDDNEVKVSVMRKLGGENVTGDCIPAAKWLLAKGGDVNARGGDGTTLLHTFSLDDEFARFLIDKRADVNAITATGLTPLAVTYNEDLALMLLEAKADPRLGMSGKQLRFNINRNHWTKVRVWLQGHGYADVLAPQANDDVPDMN